MVIDGNILIEDHQAGELGLTMSGPVAEIDPVTTEFTVPGDYVKTDGAYIIYTHMYIYDNVQNFYEQDTSGNDSITTSSGRDSINLQNGAGDDIINSGAAYYNATQVSPSHRRTNSAKVPGRLPVCQRFTRPAPSRRFIQPQP